LKSGLLFKATVVVAVPLDAAMCHLDGCRRGCGYHIGGNSGNSLVGAIEWRWMEKIF
jgi:hypothetical protein